MRIFPQQLNQELKKGLQPCYLIFGDEPLIKLEAIQSITRLAAKSGFDEKHSFKADHQINWDQVHDSFSAMSLFSPRQIIEIELEKLDKNVTNQILELGKLLNPDIIFILSGPRLNQKQTKAAWFVNLDKQGLYLVTNHPEGRFFPQWMGARLKQAGINPSQVLVNFLCRSFEGNLLAASQEIEKLGLLFPNQEISLQQLENSVTGFTHFSVFSWLDTLMAGKLNRGQRMMFQLKEEGTDIIILSWSLHKEVQKLLEFSYQVEQGVNLNSLMEKARIWSSKQGLVRQALSRLNSTQLEAMLILCAKLDADIKSNAEKDCWLSLQQISLMFLDSKVQPL